MTQCASVCIPVATLCMHVGLLNTTCARCADGNENENLPGIRQGHRRLQDSFATPVDVDQSSDVLISLNSLIKRQIQAFDETR